MPIAITLTETPVPVKIWTDAVEAGARRQLENTAALPFVFHHVAAMPDVHLGIGATVGSVVATRGAICPAAVGVDIGCGMIAQKTPVSASSFSGKLLTKLRSAIEQRVPVGFDQHSAPRPEALEFMRRSGTPHAADGALLQKAAKQLGTLGGGNHFIEVCIDESEDVWIMLHSGSRNIGKSVADVHISKAKSAVRKLASDVRDLDLSWFAEKTPEFSAYLHDVEWCQSYALANRELMMKAVVEEFSNLLDLSPDDFRRLPSVNCHHNYVARERHFGSDVLVTRKGAIRAGSGELGIIPGSMGTASFIVRGLGNADSFESAPHGAGRRMSRAEARRRFTREDLRRQTEGVECRKDSRVIDEIPGAYKDIDEVIARSSDLVEVVARLKQVLCVKG